MPRQWLCARLVAPPGPDPEKQVTRAVTELLPPLVCHLRSADGKADWRFRRGPAADTLELRFRSQPAVIADMRDRLRRRCAELGWPLRTSHDEAADLPWRETPGVGHAEARLADALSELSSELALELLAIDAFDAADHLGAAALHLRLLIELVPAGSRPAFLFLYWQHWGRSLTGPVRLELAERAERMAPEVLNMTARLAATAHRGHLWARYLRSLLASWDGHGSADDPPRPYLLFEHAHLTHGRLGIPVDAEVAAAKALRSAMAAAQPKLPDLRALLLSEDFAA